MKDVKFEFGRSPAVNPGMSERWKMVSIIEELCLTVNSVSSHRSGAKIRKGFNTMSRGSLMIDVASFFCMWNRLTVNSVSGHRNGAKIRKGYKTTSRGSLMIDLTSKATNEWATQMQVNTWGNWKKTMNFYFKKYYLFGVGVELWPRKCKLGKSKFGKILWNKNPGFSILRKEFLKIFVGILNYKM